MLFNHRHPIYLQIYAHTSYSFMVLSSYALSLSPIACPLPLKLDPSIRSLSDVVVHTTISPNEFYDTFIARVLSAREIPVIIPSPFVLYLHELFFRSQMCVSTIMDRILLMFGQHFKRRKSVLCMWRDVDWLVNISKGLLKGCFDAKRQKLTENELHEKAVQYLNEYLPVQDRLPMVITSLFIASVSIQ